MNILNSLGKPTRKYPLLGCFSVCLVNELRAGLNVVVTELSNQFLAAHKFLVFLFEPKSRKVILIVAIGIDVKIVVLDDGYFQVQHLFPKTIKRCFLIFKKVKLVNFVLKFYQHKSAT